MVSNGNGKNGNGEGAPHVPKLKPEAEEQLFEAIELGMPIERACVLVGVSSTTFYTIRDYAAKAAGGKLKAWYGRLVRARARGEYETLKAVRKGGKGTGNLLWILERSFGYYRTELREEQHEHSGGMEIVLRRLEVNEDDRRQ